MIHKCVNCDYKSNRKFNLDLHISRKHIEEIEIEVEVKPEYLKKCEKCQKTFKTYKGYNYHIKVCKGVLNPLECHYCHKIYKSRQTKSQHLKTCKIKEAKKLQIIKEEEKEAKTLQIIKEEEKIKEKEIIEVLPIVKTKRKTNIPAILRQTVWDTWIGAKFGLYKCLCCKKNQINKWNFECGHIVSEYEGGEAILENLRPICRICNLSMRTENMNEFMERLHL